LNNTVFVTGGAGFIGSAVIRHLLAFYDCDVVNIDKLTYAGNLETLEKESKNPRYQFVQYDICDAEKIEALFEKYQPKSIMHLAAESHVDRSIDGPQEFIQTNIVGTYTLLQAARKYCDTLLAKDSSQFRFHHILHIQQARLLPIIWLGPGMRRLGCQWFYLTVRIITVLINILKNCCR